MRLKIKGEIPLKGEVIIRGAKNSGFKLMIASLMGQSNSTIGNITKAGETKITSSLISYLGGEVNSIGEHCLVVRPSGLKKWEIPYGVGKESRASTLFVPALLYHFGKAKVPWPGGDRIGARPLDRHFAGMEKMGIKIKQESGWIEFSVKGRPIGCYYKFNKPTHTGTDTLLMLASFARGKTILENVALEPEVDDLIDFLNKMGAKIQRTSSKTIVVEGINKFKGTQHIVIPDRNEAVTFACATLITKGSVSIFNIKPEHLLSFIKKVKEIGGKIEVGVNEMKVEWTKPLHASQVETTPHPGFMTDWGSIWCVLMTQARGKSIFIERVFPNRFQIIHHLLKMGARINFFNPKVRNPDKYYFFNLSEDSKDYFHGVEIYGPVTLKGTTVDATDIRAGAGLLIASLAAKGLTIIENSEVISRGYENLDIRLANLGAQILNLNNS